MSKRKGIGKKFEDGIILLDFWLQPTREIFAQTNEESCSKPRSILTFSA